MVGWIRRERKCLLATLVVSTLIVVGLDWCERNQSDSLSIRSPRLRICISDSLLTVEHYERWLYDVQEFAYYHAYHKERFPDPENWFAIINDGRELRFGIWHDMTFAFLGIVVMKTGYFKNNSKGDPTGWVFKIPIAGLVLPVWVSVTVVLQIILFVARRIRRRRLIATRGFPVVSPASAGLSQEIVRKIQ